MDEYLKRGRIRRIADTYVNTDMSVRDISVMFDVPYGNMWKYMRKAIDGGIITREQYIKAFHRKDSLAKTREKNPNYNGKIVKKPEVRKKISVAMTGKIIPQDIRDKISHTKKNGNGIEKKINKV